MAIYEICVEGHCSPRRLASFAPLKATLQPAGTTLLVGPLEDQAALHGVLRRINDLNLKLLLVRCREDDQVEGSSSSGDEET
jgi:hypothetical protein